MANRLDGLRSDAESGLAALLDRLGPSQRERVQSEIDRYGSVEGIPPIFWEGLKREIDEEAAALMLLLIMGAYRTQTDRLMRQARGEKRAQIRTLLADDDRLRSSAAGAAATLGRELADGYIDGVRAKLKRSIDDQADTLNDLPGKEASRRVRDEIEVIIGAKGGDGEIVTQTTDGIVIGQGSAANDVGNVADVTVEVIWWARLDNKTCQVCQRFHGEPADKWDDIINELMSRGLMTSGQAALILRNGGPRAHKHCRCELRTVIIDHNPTPGRRQPV